MSLMNTLIEFAPYTAGFCGFMLLREWQLRYRLQKKLREEQANRRRAMDQAGSAIGDAQDAREDARTRLVQMHAVTAGLRKQLVARACPRCRSIRVARFCGNCGADQLPPGTPLVRNDDGTFRSAKDGEPAYILMGTAESRAACGIIVR